MNLSHWTRKDTLISTEIKGTREIASLQSTIAFWCQMLKRRKFVITIKLKPNRIYWKKDSEELKSIKRKWKFSKSLDLTLVTKKRSRRLIKSICQPRTLRSIILKSSSLNLKASFQLKLSWKQWSQRKKSMRRIGFSRKPNRMLYASILNKWEDQPPLKTWLSQLICFNLICTLSRLLIMIKIRSRRKKTRSLTSKS